MDRKSSETNSLLSEKPPPYSSSSRTPSPELKYVGTFGESTRQPPTYSPRPASSATPTPANVGLYNNGPPGYSRNTESPHPYNCQPNCYGATQSRTTLIVPEIIIVGACPACRVGLLEDDYTCLGIFCAIFFFPLGILCCLLLKNRRCSNCGSYFG